MPFEEANTLAWIRDLYRLSHTGTSRGPHHLPELMLDYIAAGFEAPKGCLAMRFDLTRPETIIAASRGEGVYPVGSLIPAGEALLGEAVAKAAPLAGTACACGTEGSAQCWPLMMESQVIGALCVRRQADQPAFTAQDLERGTTLAAFLSIVIDNTRLHDEQRRRIEELSRANAEVQKANRRLEDAQNQLLQSEKLASIGQLAAGVAHEINNPIGYVHSNLGSLESYVGDVFRILDAYNAVAQEFAAVEQKGDASAGPFADVTALRRELDIDFLKQDMHALLAETREGVGRVKKIVQDLKDFSRAGAEDDWHWADLHKGLDSTLNIVNNEIKYKAKVIKEYGTLPEIECLPSQLNQVFMNLLVNAAHAIEGQGVITVRTGAEAESAWVEVSDTGSGIAPENLKRIFEPFFTTKPVGKGTGLGLSLAYSIVQKHGGRIGVSSEPGRGTTFRVTLPRERVAAA